MLDVDVRRIGSAAAYLNWTMGNGWKWTNLFLMALLPCECLTFLESLLIFVTRWSILLGHVHLGFFNVTQPRPDANLTRVIHGFFSCDPRNSKNLVLIGHVKQYFAYETQHQHGAFAMTGGFIFFIFTSIWGRFPIWRAYFLAKNHQLEINPFTSQKNTHLPSDSHVAHLHPLPSRSVCYIHGIRSATWHSFSHLGWC